MLRTHFIEYDLITSDENHIISEYIKLPILHFCLILHNKLMHTFLQIYNIGKIRYTYVFTLF